MEAHGKRREERRSNEGDCTEDDTGSGGTHERGSGGGTQEMEKGGIPEILQGDEN